MTDRHSIDLELLGAVLILVAVGIIMVYSASAAFATMKFQDPGFFFKRQILRVGLGLAILALTMRIDYHMYQKFARPAFGIVILILLYMIVSDGADDVRGARRWLQFSNMSIQPSEIMKFALILYIADAMSRKQEKLQDLLYGYVPLISIVVMSVGLIVIQPDFGTASVIFLIMLTMFFVGRIKILHLVGTLVAALPLAWVTVFQNPYQMRRIHVFMNPESDPQGMGYQIRQSLISLGNGGLFGQGLGQSKQKLLYLPDPYTDFIYSIIGEEFGLIGTVGILFLFAMILWRGLRVAAKAPDFFGMMLATGITAAVVIGALVNIAVTCNLLPTTGLPLPFVSYGGTSLFLSLMAMGMLLNISQQCASGAPPRTARKQPAMKSA